ncbi:hypothetical protein C0J52_00289 [Blattella germanica]|nr:hypothetical protein C0J52_00289 [Blattella germanica]
MYINGRHETPFNRVKTRSPEHLSNIKSFTAVKTILERNPDYDSLPVYTVSQIAEKYTTLQKTLSQITSTCLSPVSGTLQLTGGSLQARTNLSLHLTFAGFRKIFLGVKCAFRYIPDNSDFATRYFSYLRV